MNDKPVVQYTVDPANFIKLGLSAYIVPIDHPSDLVSNESLARTSRVISIDGDTFETMNTKYVPKELV